MKPDNINRNMSNLYAFQLFKHSCIGSFTHYIPYL